MNDVVMRKYEEGICLKVGGNTRRALPGRCYGGPGAAGRGGGLLLGAARGGLLLRLDSHRGLLLHGGGGGGLIPRAGRGEQPRAAAAAAPALHPALRSLHPRLILSFSVSVFRGFLVTLTSRQQAYKQKILWLTLNF